MKLTNIHITTSHRNSPVCVLLLSLLLLCLAACSSGGDIILVPVEIPDNGQLKEPATPTQLYIYIHKPQTAVPTRAYEGDVDPIGQEATIYSLQIWVFTHVTNKLIGYFSPESLTALNTNGAEVYQLTIDDTYAETAEASRESVDVYVLANVAASNCHLTLDQRTTRAELEAAVLAHNSTTDAFGLTAPVMSVPENVGLPMSGVLRNQPVTGTAPVLRLDDGGQMATLSLIRTVSKIRFAFARETGSQTLTINSIKMNAEMIPEEQYLFMAADAPYDRKTCHIGSGYNTASQSLLAAAIDDVPEYDLPVYYAWGNEELEPQEYETRMDEGAAAGHLTQRLYYLRESDKKLQGEIKYQIGDGAEQTATFSMVDEGGFSRNHAWTVYAYQAQARLQVVVVDLTQWKTKENDHDFYNW